MSDYVRRTPLAQLEKLLADTSRAQEEMFRALVCNQHMVDHVWLGLEGNSVPDPALEQLFKQLQECANTWSRIDSEICLMLCKEAG